MKTSWRATKPNRDEFAPFYAGYIGRVPDGDIVTTLDNQIRDTGAFLRSLPESVGDHRYAPGKWSIREVIGHLADGERVFAYRALRFSRGDATPLPGFDQDSYVANALFDSRTLDDLIQEFEHLRKASVHMFGNLDEAAMTKRGAANGVEVSVRALAFILAGHESHHLEILRSRYL